MDDRQLAQFLVQKQLVQKGDMQKAIDMQKTIGGDLGQILVKLGYITDHGLSKALAAAEGMAYEDIGDLVLPQALINSVPRDVIEKHQVLPIHRDHDSVTLAVSDPLEFEAIDEIQFLTGKKVHTVLTSKDQLRRAITRFYYDDPASAALLGDPDSSGIRSGDIPQWKVKQALIPLLIEKGIITEKEILEKARHI